MKKLFLLLSLLTIITSASAQKLDSITLLMQQYNYHQALLEMEKIHPDSMDTGILYLKAKALNALSRFPEAIICLDSIYRSDTANITVAVELADCYKSVNNLKKPREIYEKALLQNPGNTYIRQLLAGVFLSTEQYTRAKQQYLTACTGDTTVFLLKQTAMCYEKLGITDSAIWYYQRATQWDPDDYQPAFRLANLYKNHRKYMPGIVVADSFLIRNPDNRDVNRLSGYLHYLNQEFPTAIERFQQCISLGDTFVFVYKYLGFSYFKQNEFTPAIRYLEKVYAADSSDAELAYALGLAHDRPENLRYFRAAINLTSPVVNMLAIVYQDLSLALTKDWKYHEALEALEKALQLVPGDPAILYKLGVHYDNWMNNKPMALKYYREFLATRQENSETSYTITATSVVDQGDYAHAELRVHDIEATLTSSR